MATKNSQSSNDPPASVAFGSTSLMVLQFIIASCTQIADKAKEVFGSVAPPDKKTVWGPHVPLAGEVIADMLELAPNLFTWFTRSSIWLRTTVIEIKLLTEIGSYLDALSTLINNLLQNRRVELAGAVADMKSGVDGILASKLTPPEVVQQLTEISRPLTDIVSKYNNTVQAKKKSTQAKGKQMKGLQNQVHELGGSPVVAPRQVRKTSRTLH